MPKAKVEDVELKVSLGHTGNRHRVPRSQWRKWSVQARRVFNELYFSLMRNRTMTCHPKGPEIVAVHWNTIAWNAAWLAADSVDGIL